MKIVIGQKDPYITIQEALEIKFAKPKQIELILLETIGHFPIGRPLKLSLNQIYEFIEKCDSDSE